MAIDRSMREANLRSGPKALEIRLPMSNALVFASNASERRRARSAEANNPRDGLLLSALARGGWIFRSTRARADRKIQRFGNFQRVWPKLRHYAYK